MSIRSGWDRLNGSLYFLPGLFIVASALLAFLVNQLDAETGSETVPFLLPTSVEGARTLLASIAGATITVAALVFSITALTVQLASSQYSPRVLDGFLRDRAQQVVIGVVVGTFTFSLVSLAIMGAGVRDQEGVFAAWAATVASALALATVVAIVFFVDHIARRLRIENVVRRIATETTESMQDHFADTSPNELTSWDNADAGEPTLVFAEQTGWVQRIDPAKILDAVPPGTVIEITKPVGSFAVKGGVVAKVWPPEDAEADIDLPVVEVGDSRSTGQDPGFGLRQLTDIALRALSPGINDPATAADAVRHLAEPIVVAMTGSNPRRVVVADSGARLLIPDQQSAADYLTAPFAELRDNAAGQPIVIRAMEETLLAIREQLERADHQAQVALVDAELKLVGELPPTS